MVALEPGSGMSHSSPENIEFGLHEVDETCRTALLNFPAVRSLWCKSVRSRFPDEMTQWTRWELVALGVATVKRAPTTCKLFTNIVEIWSEFKRCCAFYYSRFKPVLQQIRFRYVVYCGYGLAIGQNTGVTSLNKFALRLGKRTYKFCFKKKNLELCTFCNNLICCKPGLLICGW